MSPGTYRCLISAPAYHVHNHTIRLQNVSDATTLLVGTAEMTWSDGYVQTRSLLAGRFTLAAEKTLEIQHRCSVTTSNTGFGMATGYQDNIYTLAEFWRELEAE
ncbi:unnamed protein product [marine sediment metagenome]|uniref:Uncharacterized protein n=1 Tax=marine sediment metagenome TaxID=412755 RepID=X1VT25_9ZZZZ